jgi:hydrogenase maturation protease
MGNRTIIIGYGNIDRADDGVALSIINELRRRRGRGELEEGDTGLGDLNDHADSIFIPQLMPEIMERLTDYDRIIFVDAHVSPDTEDINCTAVLPEYSASSFTHHMTPSAFLAFLETLYHCEPEAYVVSVLGHEFDFRRTLSPRVQALVQTAADTVLELMDR